MAFKLAVISKETGNIIHIAGYGEVSARDFPRPETVLFDTILGADWAKNRVVLDLDAVPYIDSSAIGWLIQAQKDFKAAGGMLALHSVQPHVRNILGLLKIERVVPIGADAAAAKKLIGPKSRAKVASNA